MIPRSPKYTYKLPMALGTCWNKARLPPQMGYGGSTPPPPMSPVSPLPLSRQPRTTFPATITCCSGRIIDTRTTRRCRVLDKNSLVIQLPPSTNPPQADTALGRVLFFTHCADSHKSGAPCVGRTFGSSPFVCLQFLPIKIFPLSY